MLELGRLATFILDTRKQITNKQNQPNNEVTTKILHS